MTDNIFEGLRPSLGCKPYHYYKVTFTVVNKLTDRKAHGTVYICCYFSSKWLDTIQYGFNYLSCLRSDFVFSWRYDTVDFDENILYHHIKNRHDMERYSIVCFLEICGNCHWQISFRRKVNKFFTHIKRSIKKPANPTSRVFMFN